MYISGKNQGREAPCGIFPQLRSRIKSARATGKGTRADGESARGGGFEGGGSNPARQGRPEVTAPTGGGNTFTSKARWGKVAEKGFGG